MALYDVVIHGGRLIDGTGNPWFYGDVAVKGGKIARIGRINPGFFIAPCGTIRNRASCVNRPAVDDRS